MRKDIDIIPWLRNASELVKELCGNTAEACHTLYYLNRVAKLDL